VQFQFGICGQLCGCDDPTFDLAAEQARRRRVEFERDLATAIETGKHAWCSSTMLNPGCRKALSALAADPSPQNIRAAKEAFDNYMAWLDLGP
jgi:hypothetical protein